MLESRKMKSSLKEVLPSDAVELPCGAKIPNRLVKASMSESCADPVTGLPDEKLFTLYREWSKSGCGLLLSGNIMVDPCHLEHAGNMRLTQDMIDKPETLVQYKKLAESGGANGAKFYAQLSHAGAYSQVELNCTPLGPTATPSRAPQFAASQPVPMTAADIQRTVSQFVDAAAFCQKAGFSGIQLHGAHGYLLSSFLAPNGRTDEFGGESIENRARFLLTCVREIRKKVGKEYPVTVKLNSCDFQDGGFNEAGKVAKLLDDEGVDMIEISGGTMENFAMIIGNPSAKESTIKREAYFQVYAEEIASVVKNAKLMLTGGVRSRKGIQHALKNGVALLGLARPVLVDHLSPAKFLKGEIDTFSDPPDMFAVANIVQLANNKDIIPVTKETTEQRQPLFEKLREEALEKFKGSGINSKGTKYNGLKRDQNNITLE